MTNWQYQRHGNTKQTDHSIHSLLWSDDPLFDSFKIHLFNWSPLSLSLICLLVYQDYLISDCFAVFHHCLLPWPNQFRRAIDYFSCSPFEMLLMNWFHSFFHNFHFQVTGSSELVPIIGVLEYMVDVWWWILQIDLNNETVHRWLRLLPGILANAKGQDLMISETLLKTIRSLMISEALNLEQSKVWWFRDFRF